MKKIILVLFFSTLFLNSNSQSWIYHPFPDTNAFWGDRGWNIYNQYLCYNTRFGINGDTIINAMNYKKIYSLYDSTLTNPKSHYYAAIREQNKRVYTVVDPFPEDLLYDFNLSLGDTLTQHVSLIMGTVDTFSRVVTQIDSILLLDGTYRKRWTFYPASQISNYSSVVEGIGSITAEGLFQPLMNTTILNGNNYNFECFKQNDTAFYVDNPACNHCFCTLLTDIKKIKEQENLLFFPNSLFSSSSILLNAQLNDAEVIIYDMLGKEIMKKKLTGNRMEIEKGNLESGVYFVKVSTEERLWVGKIIVE